MTFSISKSSYSSQPIQQEKVESLRKEMIRVSERIFCFPLVMGKSLFGKVVTVNDDGKATKIYEGMVNQKGMPEGIGSEVDFDLGKTREGYWESGNFVHLRAHTVSNIETQHHLLVLSGGVAVHRKVFFENGNVYEGQCRKGEVDGEGKMLFANGDVYKGKWQKGRMEGQGEMIYANKEVYKGQWHKGEREGEGRMMYANGEIYKGEWRFGVREGKGKLTYPNQVVYDGEWWYDRRHGAGELIYPSGIVKCGVWWLDMGRHSHLSSDSS